MDSCLIVFKMCRTLDKIAKDITTYRSQPDAKLISLFFKTPEIIKEMEKELDSTLKLFQVRFQVRYYLITSDTCFSM